jgi:hypothetical protein
MLKAQQIQRILFWLGLFVVVLTGLINIGIIAIDDYADVVSKIVPAQEVVFSKILSERGIHTPLPALLLSTLSKVAWSLGFSQPIDQLRVVFLVIGLFSFLIHSLLGRRVFKTSETELTLFTFLIGFHFIAPLFFTRAMVETLSAPFVSLAVLWLWHYSQSSKRVALFWSAFFTLLAFQLRYQTMAIVPGAVLFLLSERKTRDCFSYLGFLLVGLFFSAHFEKYLTGEIFGLARPYFEYNLHHSSGHGVTPFYTFLLMFLALTIFPFFISRYKNFEWSRYKILFPVLFPFVSFVVLHSLIPHKEERFMIPVLPLFFILWVPLAAYLLNVRWRVHGFVILNSALLMVCSFSVPQKNIVSLVAQVAKDVSISRLIGVDETLVLYPTAYGIRKVPKVEIKGFELDNFNLQCSDAVAIRQEYVEKEKGLTKNLKWVADFEPGPLEAFLVKINPGQNARRGGIQLYKKKNCS